MQEQREGGFTYYQGRRPSAERAGGALGAAGGQFAASAARPGRARRRGAAEGSAAAAQGELRDPRQGQQLVPGRSWAAWSRALGLLLPAAGRRRPRMRRRLPDDRDRAVGAARRRGRPVARGARRADGSSRRRRGVDNITWKRGELESLPLEDASADVALLSQALHHAERPAARARARPSRILRPGGRILVLDLRRHDQAWVRDRLGDRVLGFEDEELAACSKDGGSQRRARPRRRAARRRPVHRADRRGNEGRVTNGIRLQRHRRARVDSGRCRARHECGSVH